MANFPPTPEFIKSLDPNSPINENQVLAGDDWFRFVQQVLENQFPTSEDDSANGWDIALTVKASEVNALAGITGPVEQRLSIMEGLSPALAYLNVAPTGWSIVAAIDEHSVRITQGTGPEGDPGAQEGGLSGGTNDFSAQFVASPEGGLVGDHTLTEAETPVHTHGSAGSHDHDIDVRVSGGAAGVTGAVSLWEAAAIVGTSGNTTVNTGLIKDAGTHTHNSFGGGSPHGHSVDLAVKWAACIMIARD